jgi:hypothetical protein
MLHVSRPRPASFHQSGLELTRVNLSCSDARSTDSLPLPRSVQVPPLQFRALHLRFDRRELGRPVLDHIALRTYPVHVP